MAHPVVRTDTLIVGAGPVGLYMAFQLGLLEIQAHIIDALPYPGGQPETLYPDKPIYDLPGLPCISGRELTQALMQQIAPMKVPMHMGNEVSAITPQSDGFEVQTRSGQLMHTRSIFIAAGVGAFQARQLKVADAAGVDIGRFEGTQLFYHLYQAPDLQGKTVLVCGGEDEALKAALHAAHQGAKVTVLHRRDVFKADPELMQAFETLRATGAVQVVAGQPLHYTVDGAGALNGLDVLNPEGQTVKLACEVVLPMLGLSPKLGPVADWNLAMSRKQVEVNTETFATSVPGIFAVGDINTYPGKKKLLVSGLHECA